MWTLTAHPDSSKHFSSLTDCCNSDGLTLCIVTPEGKGKTSLAVYECLFTVKHEPEIMHMSSRYSLDIPCQWQTFWSAVFMQGATLNINKANIRACRAFRYICALLCLSWDSAPFGQPCWWKTLQATSISSSHIQPQLWDPCGGN